MKKLLAIISIIGICFSTFAFEHSVSAKSKSNSDWNYVNDNGINMDKEEYDNLISQGFEPLDIQIMDEESFDMNKDIHATEVSETVKYIKTYEVNDDRSTYGVNDDSAVSKDSPKKIVNVELTEEQMNKEVEEAKRKEALGGISTFGTETGTDSTSYKKLRVVVSKLKTGRYRANTTVEWKKIPKGRRLDVIGASVRYPSYWTADHTKRGGTQYYKADGNDQYGNWYPNYYSETIHYAANSGNWTNASFSGAALVQNLKNDFKYGGKYCYVAVLRHNAWFDFTLTNSKYPYSTVNIMGAYSHQIDSSPISINGFTLTYGAPSIAFKLGNKKSSYDAELTATGYIKK